MKATAFFRPIVKFHDGKYYAGCRYKYLGSEPETLMLDIGAPKYQTALSIAKKLSLGHGKIYIEHLRDQGLDMQEV